MIEIAFAYTIAALLVAILLRSVSVCAGVPFSWSLLVFLSLIWPVSLTALAIIGIGSVIGPLIELIDELWKGRNRG